MGWEPQGRLVAQRCLENLEKFGERAVEAIDSVLAENPAFDELKGRMVKVLGNVRVGENLRILQGLVEHESLYLAKWVAEALEAFAGQESQPHLKRARERLASMDRVAGLFPELLGTTDR